MMIRSNCYREAPLFKRSGDGWLLITRRFVLATGIYAVVYS